MFSTVRPTLSAALILTAFSTLNAQALAPVNPKALVKKIQDELSGPVINDGKPNPNVPHGEFLHGTITNSKIYPGTENDFQVYIPAQYDPARPACLLLKLDGLGSYEGTVLDNLIAKQAVPVIIGVGITPGTIWKDPAGTPNRRAVRFNRSYEFDSMNDHFPDFVLNELLPAVRKLKTHEGRPINLSPNGNDHAVTGGSTGGIGSFTLAWRRPDQFTRVYSMIGTFVSMRGGHEYPALIRKTAPKPIRIFLEDGSTDAWNPLFGSWYEANLSMESALTFAGYDIAHAWGHHGHDDRPGKVIFPDVMRWLWRDYPAPINAGVSQNSTLQEITISDEGWHKIPQSFQAAAGLAANAEGDVYLSDPSAMTIYRIGAGGKPAIFRKRIAVAGQAFGPNGTLFGIVPGERRIVKLDAQGASRTVAKGIVGRGIVVTHAGTLYVSEPGAHNDMPSRIWQIKPGGEKRVVDQGLRSASGIAFSPDGSLFYAAENTTKWIYSYVVQPDGFLEDKQAFYWLHMTDIPNDSGAQDIAVDTHGNLYVATRMGVQISDQNGRVRAILPLPSPSGPVRGLCFGGEHFDFLYVTDGAQVFRRRMNVSGVAPWAAPVAFPSQGAG
ncbi:MAG TPA: SMP-30/gluconolactonase/LRE family protein [Bryobacteraceae bacterium]|nr:SMP-30/gluconolactonase/LRE family protein [Bryobacteraceae bacterium]